MAPLCCCRATDASNVEDLPLQNGLVVERALGTRRIRYRVPKELTSFSPRTTQPAEPSSLRAVIPARVPQEWEDRRRAERFPVALPAFLKFQGENHNARLINLAHGGALIETVATLPPLNSAVALHCGTIVARAMVVWTTDRQIGVKFETSLTDAQVNEQVFRTLAIASRRESKLQSGGLA